MVSWSLNSIHDAKKSQYRARMKGLPADTSGVVELNIIVFPSARIEKIKRCPRAAVSGDARVDGKDTSTYPTIRGGLTWPNPRLDWLLKGRMAEVPRLLTGDYVGSITSGLREVMDALNDRYIFQS